MLNINLNNEFDRLIGQIIRIDTEYHKLPIFGKLISVTDQFLTIERKDGRSTVIRRKAILAVEPVRNQQPEQITGGV
jgi:RNase P/RNase MRP subunit p29